MYTSRWSRAAASGWTIHCLSGTQLSEKPRPPLSSSPPPPPPLLLPNEGFTRRLRRGGGGSLQEARWRRRTQFAVRAPARALICQTLFFCLSGGKKKGKKKGLNVTFWSVGTRASRGSIVEGWRMRLQKKRLLTLFFKFRENDEAFVLPGRGAAELSVIDSDRNEAFVFRSRE